MTDSTTPEAMEIPANVAMARLAALFGSPTEVVNRVTKRRTEFMAVWNQDSAELGQILHGHLVVEFFLTEYLKQLHPTLALDQLRLQYAQKVGMIPSTNRLLASTVPGLRALGTIRNRMAHVRRVQISKDDIQAIVSVAFYAAMMQAGGSIDLANSSPTSVVLSFAQWVASTLHSATDPDNEKWAAAFDPTKNVPGSEFFLNPPASDGLPGVGRKPSLFGGS